MRLLATLGLLALAIVLFAPSASAHAAETTVHSDPPAVATEQTFEQIACIPVCDVLTTQGGNAPPALVVTSGATVTWEAIRGSHTATSDYPLEDKDNLIVDNQFYRVDVCLNTGVSSNSPGQARFAIREGVLKVLPESQFDEPVQDQTWFTCDEAIELADRAFALSYHCDVHKRTQNSLLVVVPSTP